MKIHTFKSLLFTVLGSFYAFAATAATSLFSDYGQIQNVQNYSTNPFWTPNSPYNQRLPQPVYVQNVELSSAECTSVVRSLVSVQCMARNNCKSTQISEIRPTIMVQLSNLPGKNYVSVCSGYIDGIFDEYVAQYGNAKATGTVAFPNATDPNTNINNSGGVQIANPYKQTTPKWQQEINARQNELQELQRQNGAGSEHLTATSFPTTVSDLSFTSRMALTNDSYAPYKDLKTYNNLNVLNNEEWCNEHPKSPECLEYKAKKANCTEMYKNVDTHVILAEYTNPDTPTNRVCRVVQCEPGYEPNKNKNGCMLNRGTDCTAQKASIAHAIKAAINENGDCVITACESPYAPNATGTACEKIEANNGGNGGNNGNNGNNGNSGDSGNGSSNNSDGIEEYDI